MASYKNSVEPLLNLNRIPKKKQVTDYVQDKLLQGKSEEAQSFINKIFDLYLTSPGFNALQLSKTRLKRMKAAHYKEMLLSLDEELKSIIQSEEFKQLESPAEEKTNLYSKIAKLTEDLTIHPVYSMIDEAKEAELLMAKNNETELLLHLYKKSSEFYHQSISKDNLTAFLDNYDQAFSQSKNNYLRTKYSFILQDLEQDKKSGALNPIQAETLLKNIEELLLVESVEEYKSELLLFIFRCAALLPNAYELLDTYVQHAEKEIKFFELNNENYFSPLKYFIAHYSTNASRPYRIKLLNECEKALAEDNTAEKAHLKVVKGIVHLHFAEYAEAKKHFNAAEHLIYKTSWKNIEGRNAWRNICYWRKFIFAEMIFNKDPMYSTVLFNDLEKIIQDTAANRQDSFQTKNEIEALKDFLSHKWKSAAEKYETANKYYEDPFFPYDYYFNKAMICIINEKSEAKFIAKLKSSESLFFSTTAIELLKKAKAFYKENKTSDYYDTDNHQQSNIHL